MTAGAIRYNASIKSPEARNGVFWFTLGTDGFCPTGYIRVPGNSQYNTTDFCVAKYEMKNVGGVPVSKPSETPWGNIDRNQARAACESLGAGYQFITNAQWQTIARNIAQVAENWSDGAVGSGVLNRGHSDSDPYGFLEASSRDDDACLGTGQKCSSTVWGEQRRTHVLSNGEVIWDFAGNVWEWVYDDLDELEYTGPTDPGYKGFSILGEDVRSLSGPADGAWTSSYGVGRLYGGSGGAVYRGQLGKWHQFGGIRYGS